MEPPTHLTVCKYQELWQQENCFVFVYTILRRRSTEQLDRNRQCCGAFLTHLQQHGTDKLSSCGSNHTNVYLANLVWQNLEHTKRDYLVKQLVYYECQYLPALALSGFVRHGASNIGHIMKIESTTLIYDWLIAV